jgi:predicted small secreted protein|tara:strand:+ start:34346 stop:34504 length:159 start_codon:yes stop_codon:yes gene_type:complete
MPLDEDITMTRLIALTFLTLFSVSLLAGCNTMRGAGEDIQQGGQAIEEAAES